MTPLPTIRRAQPDDLPAIVRLLSLDDAGIARHDAVTEPLDPRYAQALRAIDDDPNNAVLVATLDGHVVGTFQLTILQQLSHHGGRVGQIETVVVDPSVRSRGVGEAMMRWAIAEAERRGCVRVQLTSNKLRTRAHRFYRRLGFEASHEGMKRPL